MKTYRQLALAFFAFLVISISYAAPIENGADIRSPLKENPDALDDLVAIVKKSGHRCDSISVARRMAVGRGYVLRCNKYAYSYDVEDVGGNWRVKVQ